MRALLKHFILLETHSPLTDRLTDSQTLTRIDLLSQLKIQKKKNEITIEMTTQSVFNPGRTIWEWRQRPEPYCQPKAKETPAPTTPVRETALPSTALSGKDYD